MDTKEFEAMLNDAELHPSPASPSYGVAFLVSLHVPTQIPRLDGSVVQSLRVQCDWLVYPPAKFAVMSKIEAEHEIAQCITRLQKAAKTKQGTLPKEKTRRYQ